VAFCEPEVLLTWRTPWRQRASCLLWTALAVAAAVAMEVTGPPVPESFAMRLPLIVLAGGGTWCAARWRRRVTVTADAVTVRTLWRTRRIPLATAVCSTALGTSLFIARSQRPFLRLPVTMVTPWLVVTATLGIALLTAKLLTEYPQLTGAMLAGGAAACLTAVGACLPLDRLAAARASPGRGRDRAA
jgi:hypothetical protein